METEFIWQLDKCSEADVETGIELLSYQQLG